ncbi:unnamed protein product [Litomosoides sigmodontis]|uniref:Uncharacterized protein n=1 Tax=Litomosoides sigmodontis TaxID=42156 RepID=A0A3P6UF57_LITSI|nr:unnamed protein product [Litomosoides sigmodontis]
MSMALRPLISLLAFLTGTALAQNERREFNFDVGNVLANVDYPGFPEDVNFELRQPAAPSPEAPDQTVLLYRNHGGYWHFLEISDYLNSFNLTSLGPNAEIHDHVGENNNQVEYSSLSTAQQNEYFSAITDYLRRFNSTIRHVNAEPHNSESGNNHIDISSVTPERPNAESDESGGGVEVESVERSTSSIRSSRYVRSAPPLPSTEDSSRENISYASFSAAA